MIDRFMNRPNSKGEKYPENQRPHALVSTFQLISTGLNLDRACRVIFLEPSTQYLLELKNDHAGTFWKGNFRGQTWRLEESASDFWPFGRTG
jgi:hypothetical protein